MIGGLLLLVSYGCSKKTAPVPPNFGTIKDVDENTYKTVKIGNQVWMAENLRVTHYQNKKPIKEIKNPKDWSTSTEGAYCNYNNDCTNVATYGRLYNYYAVSDPQKLCPEGWHVPSLDEWDELIKFTGSDTHAGGNLKEEGTEHWNIPNFCATDIYKFTGLPGGLRDQLGNYFQYKINSNFWTSTKLSAYHTMQINQSFNYAQIFITFNSDKTGLSVRCIKDCK